MDIYQVYRFFLPFFRKKRARFFRRQFEVTPNMSIVDVGGYHFNWKYMDVPCPVTCVNLHAAHVPEEKLAQFTFEIGDGRNLQFEENAFDIGYSNSVIEHVGDFEAQAEFASEIQRVAKRVFVQTPNRWFFVEPHLLTPFFHFLPRGFQDKTARYLTVWGLITKPDRAAVQEFLDDIRLLTGREMQNLFPGCKIYKERFLFIFVKSYIAVTP